MNKIVIIDGNNFMFRAYYATAYTGSLMKNSKGLVTNALYGFANMLNKIIEEEKPQYMAVCYDIGKSFRHEEYKEYKAGRNATPEELKTQMPISKELLDHMGIKYFEMPGYEADDIVGTLAKWADKDPEWDALLVTSDHDYLQLITDVVTVKMLKPKGEFTKYTPKVFKEEYGIDPVRVTDLKGLMGDSSDNIPGVPGVGEKTALKLLQEWGTLENLYDHIDEVKGKLHDKLIDGKDSAFFSKKLATIYKDVPLEEKFEDMTYEGPRADLDDFYRELEFYSLIKNKGMAQEPKELVEFKILDSIEEIDLKHQVAYYIECDDENYHKANVLGMGLYDGTNAYYVRPELVRSAIKYIKDTPKYTFDLKKNMVLLEDLDLNTVYDLSISAYLLNKTLKDDIAILMNNDGIECPFYHDIIKNKMDVADIVVRKAKYIFDTQEKNIKDLQAEEMYKLFDEIEMPLVRVLAKMERNGIICDPYILRNMSEELKVRITELEGEIYKLAGVEFNISSPKQLSEVLFENLMLPHGSKKNTNGYSTSADVLEKLVDKHPIINKILEYRTLTKLNSTYLEGLEKYILKDGKIHTIYKQTLTRTGRLSSVEPNLQNIPARDSLGKLVRKAFVPEYDYFMSCDYSQIELRILAHISKSEELQRAFINGEDIHSRVAADIFNKDIKDVKPNERRIAKSVIFGIVYGISGFGLGENIGIPPKEAKKFIDKYYELYPGVKKYMDMIIRSAYDSGYVRTLFNRKREIDELFNKNFMVRQSGERIALNTPIQGTGADILKKAMVEIDKAFEVNGIKSKMLLQIHDELVFDVLEEEKEKVKDIVTTIMVSVIKLDVPLVVSHDFGKDLYEAK